MAGRKQKRGDFGIPSSYDYYTPGWKGLLALVLFFLLGMLIANILGIVFVLCSAKGWLSENFFADYGMLICYPLMFIPAMIFAGVKSRANEAFDNPVPLDRDNFGKMGGLGAALAAVLLMLSAALALDPVSALLPPMDDKTRAAMDMLLNGPLAASILTTCIFAPVFEEWLCRGMILRSLLRISHPAIAIMLSALFFALIHGNLWQAIPAFIIGVVFGWIYYKTGSLKLTMLMHCVNNSFSLLISRLPAVREYETFKDMFGGWNVQYLMSVAACLLICVFVIYMFGRIKPAPAEEHTEPEA